MSRRPDSLALVASAALALAACDDGPTAQLGRFDGSIHVVNGARTTGAVQVWIDTQVVTRSLEPGQRTPTLWVRSGQRVLALVPPNAPNQAEEVALTVNPDRPRLVVLVNDGTAIEAFVADDTGSIVPEGATKLRVANAANAAGALDIWRQGPGEAAPTRIMTPFPSSSASPYLQAAPGTWTVTVTARDAAATTPGTPLATATLALTAGHRGSMVVVNGATPGTVAIVPVVER